MVGSSAMSSRGAHEIAMAPTMRWRMPPDIWCGYSPTRDSGAEMRTDFSRSLARLQAPGAPHALVHAERLRDLVPDGEERIQRGHRILQDHRDALAANAPHLDVGLGAEILALEEDLPARDLGRGRQQAQDGQRERALAGAGLAHDAEGAARLEA